ncbi:MAG: YiiX/YebB-like N1pC/P60 family cysteine hydrolase [Chitinophagaceae bacterium]
MFLFISCNNKEETQKHIANNFRRIDSIKSAVKNGDLVFRNGTDDVSRAARSFNRIDTTFSHCGLLQIENGSVFVYHALGGDYNPGNKLRRDPIDSFCSPFESDKFAVYRYELNQQQNDSLTTIIRNHYLAGLEFDLYFNFLTDDKMYCSEFVFKCLDKSLSGSLSNYIKARQWPFGISPDDLFLYPGSRLIKRVDFDR